MFNSYHFLLGPIVALAALALIVLLCRWVFSTTTRDKRAASRAVAASSAGDYGLLVPIATTDSQERAQQMRAALRAAGIRATVTPGATAGAVVVMVFRDDESRARNVLTSSA